MRAKSYRVHLRTKPGMYAQYSGYIDVSVNGDNDPVDAAFTKLRKTYPNITRDMWNIDKIERTYHDRS